MTSLLTVAMPTSALSSDNALSRRASSLRRSDDDVTAPLAQFMQLADDVTDRPAAQARVQAGDATAVAESERQAARPDDGIACLWREGDLDVMFL